MWPFKKKCEIPPASTLKRAVINHIDSTDKEYTKYIEKVSKDYKKYVVDRLNKGTLHGWTNIYPPLQAGFEGVRKDDNFKLFNEIQFELLDKGYEITEYYSSTRNPSISNIYLHVSWKV